MSQQSIDGLLGGYTSMKTETIDTNEFRQPGAPAVQPSLSCEVVSHMFDAGDQRLGNPALEVDEITAGPSQMDAMSVAVESASRHLKHPALPTSLPSESPSVHLTDIVPQHVFNNARPKKKPVRRPTPKRVLRVEEARRTMAPEEFDKWRAYREKNNRSVQLSRQRKRDAKKEAEKRLRLKNVALAETKETERLRLKNLALAEKIASLESTTHKYMDMLVNNAT